MRPLFAIEYSADMGIVHSVLLGQFLDGQVRRLYVYNLLFGQLGAPMLLTPYLATLSLHIQLVLLVSAKPQMIGIYAQRFVTRMTDKPPTRYFANPQHP